jgi:hypothetical protein
MSTPADLTRFDASAHALCFRVARFLVDESLKDPRFGRMIGTLEDVLSVARRAGDAGGQTEDIARIRNDLGQILRTVENRQRGASELQTLLQARHQQRARLIESSGQRTQEACRELAGGIAQLEAHVTTLAAQAAQVPPLPERPPSPGPDPWMMAGGGALLLMLLVGLLYSHFHRQSPQGSGMRRADRFEASPSMSASSVTVMASSLSGSSRAPSSSSRARSSPPPPEWQSLWAQALQQPVVGCRTSSGPIPLVACACPEVSATQCRPDPSWSGRMLVTALQAVLHVKQPEVWIDGEMGPTLSAGLEKLIANCTLSDEADEWRDRLSRSTAISEETNNAALQLLRYLQQNPSCVG